MTQPIHPMLERVARALCVADWDQGDDNWRAYLPDARSAVQALMEPDDDMIRAMLAVEWPATYKTHLRHPNSGPRSVAETEKLIEREKRRLAAALRPLVEGEGE